MCLNEFARKPQMTTIMKLPEPGEPEVSFAALLQSAEHIPGGTSRDVYAIPDHPNLVLKVARANCETVNRDEVEVWEAATTEQRKCLATMHTWSANHTYVVMERLQPLTWGDARVERFNYGPVLSIITDFKPTNMGEATDGTIKMLDYALRKAPQEPSSFAGILDEE